MKIKFLIRYIFQFCPVKSKYFIYLPSESWSNFFLSKFFFKHLEYIKYTAEAITIAINIYPSRDKNSPLD
jgi:hypothetical protein